LPTCPSRIAKISTQGAVFVHAVQAVILFFVYPIVHARETSVQNTPYRSSTDMPPTGNAGVENAAVGLNTDI
jgi:hypothetical protein